MDTIETLSVDCTALSAESSWIAKSTDSSKTTNSSSRSPTLSSSSLPKPQSSINRSSTLIASTSGSTTPLILTDAKSLPTEVQAPSSSTEMTQSHATTPNSITKDERTTNSNLSKGGEVSIGIVVPSVGVLCAVIFGINQWRKNPKRSDQTSKVGSEAEASGGTGGTPERQVQSPAREGPSLPSHSQVPRSNRDVDQGS